MFILFQQNESDNLIKTFTTRQLAVDYAMEDIKVFDDVRGDVELLDNDDDNVVAVISSDRCESHYVVFEEEIDQVR